MKKLFFYVMVACIITGCLFSKTLEPPEENKKIKKTKEIIQEYSKVLINNAELLKVSPEDLWKKFQKESSWNPKAISHDRMASGLWQARKTTRKELGLNKPLKDYTSKEQIIFHTYFCVKNNWLKIVEKIPQKERGFRLWLIGFSPKNVMKNTYTFPNKVYKSNPGLDLNKDKQITLKELKEWYNQ